MVVAMVVANVLRVGRAREGFGNKEEDSFDVALEELENALTDNVEEEDEDEEDEEEDIEGEEEEEEE